MKSLLLIPILFTALFLSAQEKGAVPLPAPPDNDSGVTRAVVIGISDYQDESIPDLRFAHKDASTFVQWLKSEAGGSVPEDNIRLLTNEDATSGRLNEAFGWLMEQSQKGDRAVIFFSGHGDVDTKMFGNPGYLLTWDTPAKMYMAGAFSISNLQLIASTLSQLNQSKVILITDACRAGNLAGNSIGGARYTNANLARQFEAEIKILSCQPDEYSLEGEEWGGGRGAFSYHLVDGLYGLADRESDGVVDVSDIDRYLEDHVNKEVEDQTPLVIGDKKAHLSKVIPGLLARWKEKKEAENISMQPVWAKGLEDEVLSKVDTNIRKLYYAFRQAVEDKVFLEPVDSCANAYYEKLVKVAEMKPLYGAMKRNFAAALQDDAQQAINGWLRSDPKEVESYATPRGIEYLKFPPYLEKAADLLGPTHYMYNDLKAKKAFFQARGTIMKNGDVSYGRWDSTSLEQLRRYIRKGLNYNAQAPYLHAKMHYYHVGRGDFSSAIGSLDSAMLFAPQWIQAYCWQARNYIDKKKFDNAFKYALKAYQLDSNYLRALSLLKKLYNYKHEFEKSRSILEKQIAILTSRESPPRKNNLGIHYYYAGNAEKAEALLTSYLQQDFDSSFFYAPYSDAPHSIYALLGWVKYVQGDLDGVQEWFNQTGSFIDTTSFYIKSVQILTARQKGDSVLLKQYLREYLSDSAWQSVLPYVGMFAHTWDPIHFTSILIGGYGKVDDAVFILSVIHEKYPDLAPVNYHLGRLYIDQKDDYEKGIPLLEKAVQLDPQHVSAPYHLGAAYAHVGKKEPALSYLEKALEMGYDGVEGIPEDERWDMLRETKEFKALMERYRKE